MVIGVDIYCNKSTGTEYTLIDIRVEDDGSKTYFICPVPVDISKIQRLDKDTFKMWYEPQWIPKVGDIVSRRTSQKEYMIYGILHNEDARFGEHDDVVKLTRKGRVACYCDLKIFKKMFIKIK